MRKAKVERNTKETQISSTINLDGVGKSNIDTGIGYSTFLNGTGKYKDYIGLKCPYAVKFFEDRTFFKKKCKL